MSRAVVQRLAMLAIAAAVSACAVIPSSGPVTRVRDDGDLGQSAARYSPARPVPGASPEQIVRGYLDAMLAFPTSSRTASAFLTPIAARTWAPSSQVRVYSQPEVSGSQDTVRPNDPPEETVGPVKVRLGFTEDARLDRQGRYARVASPGAVDYTLEKVKGQWRITDPQEGLLVNQKFFTDYFRSFDLFYFDRPGRRLVPDPVYVVVGDQLATTLVASLAGGPDPTDQATRSYVPARSALRPSVPVSADGVADVAFTDDFADLSSAARDRLSAQVVWTLRQVPEVESIQIVGDSTALSAGGEEVQPVQAWGGFGPSTARGRAYAAIGDRVVEIDGGEPEPLSGTWGDDARGAELVAVSESGVAGVLAGRDRVRVTARDGSSARTIRGNDLISPDWDPDGRLWLVDRGAGGTRVRTVLDDEERVVAAPELAALDVDTFEISPDGTRYAVTSDGALYVGSVLRDVRDRVLGLGAPQRVFTTAQSPRAASWSSGTELTFLADSEAGVQIYRAAIDGSATASDVSRSGALLPDIDARTLAVGPDASPVLYVSDARGRLWYLPPDGTWRQLDTPKVTGLTFGR